MAVNTLDSPVSGADESLRTEDMNVAEESPAAPPTLYSSLNRTLTGWEVLFYTFIVLLGTALLVDLWFLLHSGP